MNEKFRNLGFLPADILLPKDADMTKWSVVACDQFTSQPEYWEAVERFVGDAPSTLRLILPEAHLHAPDVDAHIARINERMEAYLDEEVFTVLPEALVYVERTQSDGRVRHGLVGRVDLEQYDFTPGSGALIRATEGTVLSRIPPRVRVRQRAPLEVSHVMLLIDDPADTVLGPLRGGADGVPLYDFPLQQGGGSIRGWKLNQTEGIADALEALRDQAARQTGGAPLLFAVGDGNHSLATAKQCYEDWKAVTPQAEWADLPARYALVEVVNLHDEALQFEPIHRVLFGVQPEELLSAFRQAFPGVQEGPGHTIEFVWEGHTLVLTVPHPAVQLAAGTLQGFLDAWVRDHGGELDYIHGDDTARDLGARPGNMGFLLPPMEKRQLFPTVIADGVLPRKTFSMGHAQDKRYYLEGRRIR